MRGTILLLAIVLSSGCGKKENSTHNAAGNKKAHTNQNMDSVRNAASQDSEFRDSYFELYNAKWGEYSIQDKELVKKAQRLLSSKDFRVIWNWDTDADGVKEYFCVVMDPSVRKSIRKGVLIDEKGRIKLVMDLNKGIYTRKYHVYDFKRMGILPGEIKCIRLLFEKSDIEFTKEYWQEKNKQLPPGGRLTDHDIFMFQLIDQGDHLYGILPFGKDREQFQYVTFFIDKTASIRPLSVRWTIMNPRGDSEASFYAGYQKMSRLYRKSKKANRIKAYNK